MVGVNQQFEDDIHGSGGSRSSIDEISSVNASQEVEMEPAICIYKEIINEERQKFLPLMIEEFGLDTLKNIIQNYDYTASTSGSQALQLQFLNGISTPVSSGMDIEGEDHKPFIVALVDGTGKIVSTGAAAASKVEIVVLEGDCNDDEAWNWSSDEFNSKIISDWNGKKVLQGNVFLNLKEGVGSVDKLSFTHNKTWKKKRNCRLGARFVNAALAKEAKTESFLVGDKRKLLYNKHPTPSLSDEPWRLNMISRRSDCFKRMSEANIKTVMDILTFHAINPKRLKDILDVGPKKWKVITDHAQKCKDDKGVYLYHHPRDVEKNNGVVFNIFGKLVGLIAEAQFIPSDKLPSDRKRSWVVT
ncbi:Calmodulin binding protein-like protein [Cynara cardunculus var. scolymus]|uniref:Calmodulin binding protein-like protein n=1 Tax=Cynara cardunculus var. scolymus TaxID=59895 RepID=A0A124SDW4_CYNCS|nr:Calmodulin binding protein-like protein [Cynara cardunculus var. scolymus]